MNKKSIFIAMPCLGGVSPQVVDSVFQNMTNFVKENCDNVEEISDKVEIKTVVGSLVYDARSILVKSFIEDTDKTHLFFWDSDVILFGDTLSKLMEFDLDVVSVVYYGKEPPHHPVFGIERMEVNEDKVGTKRITNNAYLKNTIQEVWGVGLGGCLIKREVLLKMMEEYDNPFFPYKSLGEDYAFCERLREQSITVNIAPQIRTFHLGGLAFQVDDYEKQLRMFMAHKMNEEANKMREEQDIENSN